MSAGAGKVVMQARRSPTAGRRGKGRQWHKEPMGMLQAKVSQGSGRHGWQAGRYRQHGVGVRQW